MLTEELFRKLEEINHRPQAYEHYTTPELWCDPHISKQMLALHISADTDLASRKKDFCPSHFGFPLKARPEGRVAG